MTKTEISAERMADIRREWATEDPEATAEQWERLREAAAESSISGSLRRAIHAGRRTVIQLAQDIGLDSQDLSEWMQGVRTLRSDVLKIFRRDVMFREVFENFIRPDEFVVHDRLPWCGLIVPHAS